MAINRGSPLPTMSAQERQFKAEADLRTLTDADDIRRDPERHKFAQRHARKQLRSYKRVLGRTR